MKRFLFICLIISAFLRLSAVPAYPYPVTFTQPNGEQVTLIMQGDEFVRFAQTPDGYTLLYNNEGYFCYARMNAQGDIEPSAFYAEDIEKRSEEINTILANTSKELRYSKSQISTYQQIRNMVEAESRNNRENTTGVRKLLAILMQYPDMPFKKTQEDFNNLFNQVKYTEYEANGSVKDFFLESSYSKLEVQTTVVGPFTAKNKHAYYSTHQQELATEAVYAAADSIDFSEFAINEEVPSFYMIFAGHGQEAGAGTDCIWSHAWVINPVFLNGVKLFRYACSPELRDAGGSAITRIGVICHEFGHSLGAPDYYDTNYGDDGQYEGTGYWDLQASGSWNDNGRTPAPPNPRSKVYTYGWATAIELDSAQTVTIPSSRIYDNAYFRINTQTPDEFFILENKTKGGYDNYIPGVNMLIYRCAANLDKMNTTSPQKFYPVAANAPVDLPGSGSNCQSHYGSVSSGFCSWPGYTGKKEFSDNTIPAMISWNREPTNLPISNITVHGNFITFDILEGGEKNNHLVFLPHYHGCTILPEPESVSPVPTGENFEFQIIIDPTYSHSNITVKSNDIEIIPSNNIYTLSNIQSDQIVTIEGLKINTLKIIATSGANGSISPIDTVEAPVGSYQHFDILPNLGFSIEDVFADGVSVGPVSHYVFKNVTEEHTIYARFRYGNHYFIYSSPNVLQFKTPPGVCSEPQFTILTSPGLAGNVEVIAPDKFEISGGGIRWYKSFLIIKNHLPYKLYVRYIPDEDDRENALGKIILRSKEAYAEVILVGNIALNISENETQKLIIYPNPTTGELKIETGDRRYETGDRRYEIYDIYGRKIEIPRFARNDERYEIQPQADGVVLNISHLPSGIYFLQIQTPSGVFYEKIIKN